MAYLWKRVSWTLVVCYLIGCDIGPSSPPHNSVGFSDPFTLEEFVAALSEHGIPFEVEGASDNSKRVSYPSKDEKVVRDILQRVYAESRYKRRIDEGPTDDAVSLRRKLEMAEVAFEEVPLKGKTLLVWSDKDSRRLKELGILDRRYSDDSYGLGSLALDLERSGLGIRLLREAADEGLADAQHRLALEYRQGRHVERDDQKAFTLFEQASAQNHEGAHVGLALMYHYGVWVKKDEEKALDLFQRAEAAGGLMATCFVGLYHLEGKGGLAQDVGAAEEYFVKAKSRSSADLECMQYSN